MKVGKGPSYIVLERGPLITSRFRVRIVPSLGDAVTLWNASTRVSPIFATIGTTKETPDAYAFKGNQTVFLLVAGKLQEQTASMAMPSEQDWFCRLSIRVDFEGGLGGGLSLGFEKLSTFESTSEDKALQRRVTNHGTSESSGDYRTRAILHLEDLHEESRIYSQ